MIRIVFFLNVLEGFRYMICCIALLVHLRFGM